MSEFKVPDGTMVSMDWVDVDKLLAEHNPNRYHLYSSLFPHDEENVLDMKISPMYKFVLDYSVCAIAGKKFDYVDTQYYEMQKRYGRKHPYIVAKMSNFMKLFNDIKTNGLMKPPVVIPKGDGSYHIKDGHHRVACCMVLGMKKVVCKIMRGQG